MQKVVLSKINLIYGFVETPKGFEIDRKKIKNDILHSYVNEKRVSDNDLDYSYQEYKITHSQKLQWLFDYIRDHYRSEHDETLIIKKMFGTVIPANGRSINKNNIDPIDLKNAPDYTCLYGVDIQGKCEITIEYDDCRRKGRTWKVSMENNKYYIFPSTLRYFITSSDTDKFNIILTTTYEYI
jgi:hypothetical protein